MVKIALFIHQDSIEVPPDFIKEVIITADRSGKRSKLIIRLSLMRECSI